MKNMIGKGDAVDVVSDSVTVRDVVANKMALHTMEDKDDAFFVMDLGDIVRKYQKWRALLPRVDPFYAVKCNENPAVLQILASLGTGFDCASKSEIQEITDLGVDPSRIVYANPCKPNSHLKFAAKKNARLMTFDNEMELHKVKAVFPGAKLLLRILTDHSTAQCQLGLKYGCHPHHAPHLLKVAKGLDLNVVGVSFHVGSGCRDARTFAESIESARMVFDYGEQLGFKFDMLDIGSVYPGQVSAPITFEEMAVCINHALEEYFPKQCGVRIIAEPGRYFVASAFTLTVHVIAKRTVARDVQTFTVPGSEDLVANTVAPTDSEEPAHMYYCNDGVYGSFNCLLYDHATVSPTLIKKVDPTESRYSTSIWGQSCDGVDRIMDNCLLPELDVGDWIVFEDMGAYTMCAASTFNGFPKPKCYYIATESLWSDLQQILPEISEEKTNEKSSCCEAATCPPITSGFHIPRDTCAHVPGMIKTTPIPIVPEA